MTREEAEREAQDCEPLDGSGAGTAQRESSFPISRRSTDRISTKDRRSLDQRSIDKVVEKAEKQALKTEKEGASEDPQHDRTITSVRSPSAERTGGAAGKTLPVVQEDGEANSREESIQDEKAGPSQIPHRPPLELAQETVASPGESGLPSIPKFNRLSLGLGSPIPTKAEY